MTFKANFSDLLTSFRRAKGWSQGSLAKATGMDPSYISRIEKSTRNPPNRDKVLAIGEVLQLTPDEMDSLLLAAGYAPENPTRRELLPEKNLDKRILHTSHRQQELAAELTDVIKNALDREPADSPKRDIFVDLLKIIVKGLTTDSSVNTSDSNPLNSEFDFVDRQDMLEGFVIDRTVESYQTDFDSNMRKYNSNYNELEAEVYKKVLIEQSALD